MPLTNKYLKYSPEITLKIFKKIWDKLVSNGWFGHSNGLESEFIYFQKAEWCYLRQVHHSKEFGIHKHIDDWLTETTVQEILGYNPFIKDDFVLPEKWFITISDENKSIVNQWKFNQKYNMDLFISNPKVVEYDGNGAMSSDYFEINFDQFKKYVLKEAVVQNELNPIKANPIEKELNPTENYNLNKFRVGDLVVVLKSDSYYHNSEKFPQRIKDIYGANPRKYVLDFRNGDMNIYQNIRFATPSEIHEYLKVNPQTHPLQENSTDKMILSVNNEELPMVSIIKIKTIK